MSEKHPDFEIETAAKNMTGLLMNIPLNFLQHLTPHYTEHLYSHLVKNVYTHKTKTLDTIPVKRKCYYVSKILVWP